MKIIRVLCVLLFCNILYARLNILDNEIQQVTLLSTKEMRFCYISFVEINGIVYLIKQKKEPQFLRKIVGVVRDSVTADIAESFLAIAHQVDIIPAGVEFIGKPSKDWPATIHTIAPGKMIKEQNSAYRRMKIQQKEKGIKLSMFEWMKKHPTLISVIALDIFVCNHDRHRGNLFYNKKKDSFCCIDMDSAYKYNLCAIACKNFMNMLNDKTLRLTHSDIKVLIELQKKLEYLIAQHSPLKIVAMYDYFAEKAGFTPGKPLYTERIALELKANREMIYKSYQDAIKLVKIMEQLIRKYQK